MMAHPILYQAVTNNNFPFVLPPYMKKERKQKNKSFLSHCHLKIPMCPLCIVIFFVVLLPISCSQYDATSTFLCFQHISPHPFSIVVPPILTWSPRQASPSYIEFLFYHPLLSVNTLQLLCLLLLVQTMRELGFSSSFPR